MWLTYYPPGVTQQHHDHEAGQLSMLLSGCFAELSGGREYRPMARHIGLMPAGEGHAVRFGREGALILSINCEPAAHGGGERRKWRRMGAASCRHAALMRLLPDHAGELAGALVDSFGEAEALDPSPLSAAPVWLRRALAQIAEAPDTPVADLAREAGVHRAHFSRRFQRHTGLTPTEFRLLRKSAAAMRRTLDGEVSLAQAALEAGFADQAHWTRTCRVLAGIPPGRVRRLLSA